MSNRILGMIGPGKGPWINTQFLPNPRAKLIGLLTGKVRVIMSHDMLADHHVVEIESCGLHKLVDAPFMRVEYDGSDMIVCTLHGAKVAVP